MSKMRNLLIIAAVTLLGSQATTSTYAASAKPLKVGITLNPPLVYSTSGGDIVGLEADFARGFAKALGKPIRFVPHSPSLLIPALQDGNVDIIMSGLRITPERASVVRFANPYLESGQAVLFHKDDAPKYTDYRKILPTHDLVGVLYHSCSEFFVKQVMYRARHEAWASNQQAVQSLLVGKLDLVLCDSPAAMWLLAQHRHAGVRVMPQLLTSDQLAWAVRRDNTAMLDAANKVLAAWKQNGWLKASIQRWAPDHDTLKPVVIQ